MGEKIKALKAAFPVTIPVMMGYLFIGVAFGMLMAGNGFSFIWSAVMSLFVYAGSMQFVAANFLAVPVDWLSIALVTVMVNIRHVFYGLAMLQRFRNLGRKKPYMVFSLTDETFSALCSAKAPQGVDSDWFVFFISLLDQLYWVVGSALGGLIGSLIPFNTKGIDFAMTAFFTVIFIDQWQSSKKHLPAAAGVLASVLCLLLFGASNFILPAMIAIVLILAAYYKTPTVQNGGWENAE
jgi:4-azaleucine resistance transporter AzlC